MRKILIVVLSWSIRGEDISLGLVFLRSKECCISAPFSLCLHFVSISIYYRMFFIVDCYIVKEKIKNQIAQIVPLTTSRGLFISIFDAQGKLLASNGVVKTDRTLEMLIESFYQGIIQKYESQTKTIVVDIIDQLQLQNDPNELLKLSMRERGLFLVQAEGQNS